MGIDADGEGTCAGCNPNRRFAKRVWSPSPPARRTFRGIVFRSFASGMTFAALLALPAAAETVIVPASHDATVIEDPDGAWANGSGPFFFAGRTNQEQNGVRRALLRFDVATALPDQAIIEAVSLTLYLSPSHPELREVRLYRVLSEWSEGPSSSAGGGGRPSEPGDVTWLHTFYDSDFWVHSGGQFLGRDSGALQVGDSGFYTWESSRHLVQDVALWKAAPDHNFGWILIGDETTRQNVKSFASRENPEPALRPFLEVTYRLPGPPSR